MHKSYEPPERVRSVHWGSGLGCRGAKKPAAKKNAPGSPSQAAGVHQTGIFFVD